MAMSSAASPSSVAIRRATPADAPVLAAFAEAAFADTFAADNTPEDMAAYLAEAFGEEKQREELADRSRVVLLAERDGELAGYAMLNDVTAPAGTTSMALTDAIEIARLYAGRRWIGTGIGPALMQACLDLAVERKREWVWLGVWERNARAIAFYARWGFTDVGSQSFQLGADRQTDRIMARRLAAQE
jgi:ribosomal protein S18 acetylase RimI-like enzyme